MEKLLFTSESVTEGHPDKMCDQISDAILDAIMEKDPMSRVACETATTTGLVLVMGEITTNAYVDIQKIVRDTVREIGYDRGKYGFDADTCAVITAIDEQSADIALGVACATVGKRVMTLSFNMNFIKNIHAGERATAVAVVRHNGHRTMVVDVDTVTDDGVLMTRATATMFVRDLYDNIPESW